MIALVFFALVGSALGISAGLHFYNWPVALIAMVLGGSFGALCAAFLLFVTRTHWERRHDTSSGTDGATASR